MGERHHIVPDFYLRRFAAGKSIRMFGRTDVNVCVSTKDAAVRVRFYRVKLTTGSESDFVEDLLCDVEGKAAPILRALDTWVFPRGEKREWLAYFLALQIARTQLLRINMKTFLEEIARTAGRVIPKEVVRKIRADDGEPDLAEEELDKEVDEIRQLVAGAQLQMDVPNEYYVETMLNLATRMAPVLSVRPLRIVRFTDPGLITSDAPVVLHSNDSWSAGGVASADMILFPMDPKTALVLGLPGEPDHEIVHGERDLLIAFNRLISLKCDQYIFLHPENPLAQEHMEWMRSLGDRNGKLPL